MVRFPWRSVSARFSACFQFSETAQCFGRLLPFAEPAVSKAKLVVSLFQRRVKPHCLLEMRSGPFYIM